MASRELSRDAAIGATERLANIIVSTGYADIPEDALSVGKAAILDGLGNMIAGSTEPLGPIVIDFVRFTGGHPQSTVIGTGFKTSAPSAAFANGTFCHCLDYEPMWVPPTHPTSPVLAALLALTELEGKSGKELLLALVLGFETQGRMNLAIQGTYKRGFRFHPPSTVGMIGSAVASAKLLALDSLTTRRAIGIAATRAGGILANTGTMSKSQHSANGARGGVEGALLARGGYTANESILEVEDGFAVSVFGEGFDFDALTDSFGKPHRSVDPGLAFKFYPAQFTTHWTTDAALDITQEHQFSAKQVVAVHARVGKPNWSAPRVRPATGLEGKFSIPYMLAVALLDRKITIDSFADEKRFSPDVVAMLERITVVEDPAIPPGLDFANTWAEVTVTLDDGRRLSQKCIAPRGRWDRPLTRAERLSKFHDCARRRLSDSDIQRTVELVERIETLGDLSELMEILGQTRSG